LSLDVIWLPFRTELFIVIEEVLYFKTVIDL